MFISTHEGRLTEQVATYVDTDGGAPLLIYDIQVREATRILGEYINIVTDMAKITDRLAEHSRRVGAKAPRVFNSLTVDIWDEALLIVDTPIEYEPYMLNPGNNEPIIIGAGTKAAGSIVRFDSIRFSAVLDDDLEIVPQAEVIEYQPGSKPSVYNRLVFNPLEQRLALMEIDTPGIEVS